MQSMTGCGRSRKEDGRYEVTVELKSVNHRFLDLAIRVPRTVSFLEEAVRKGLQQRLHRGHVEVTVGVNSLAGGKAVQVDTQLALAYAGKARELAEALELGGAEAGMPVFRLMQLEGVTTVTEEEPDEEALTALTVQAVEEAAEQLRETRRLEGERLRQDLKLHLDQVAEYRQQVLERAPGVVEDYRARLHQRISQLIPEGADETRLAQEVALMADRCAIDEELARLESHITQMNAYLAAEGEIGKKMDFLVQEMNRETNTIGSKANDAAIARLVVEMKSEIEKLREQIQNVE